MFEYIIEIISIVISIKILEKVEKYVKTKKVLETSPVGWLFKFMYWWIILIGMIIVWEILASIFGYSINNTGEFGNIMIWASVNGFSSRCFGKIAFWTLLLFTLLLAWEPMGLSGAIVSMIFFFISRHYDKIITFKISESSKILTRNDTLYNKSDLLTSYLLEAKELSSKAMNDFQNNNIPNAIEKWKKSLECYKKAEKIAKSNKDNDLELSIRDNIKSIIKNILNAKIDLISNKLRG
ncbi:hypothetical protein Metvu_1005 [Methanocaldococcus vulcanius M7]|uniref:Uncharacterized protein n=1 Tax=Methanocaldococcus vulcanius (strain ATCC 700851 / DSM 12094 / M7) TaxID=579137 RepID=C9RH11_METVM|nr:hypothetical protein [Methanocaldococcus vulcanius]ACX72863.1 hypothetical protein Metvu_1005 [Methanocaldococcus vulcanius M7]